jgi:hypothetical protein
MSTKNYETKIRHTSEGDIGVLSLTKDQIESESSQGNIHIERIPVYAREKGTGEAVVVDEIEKKWLERPDGTKEEIEG